ncbi:hypothetical protein HYU21_01095 [Candidatus Woesearchaeota archaeon]|nr:hypothetical protein [Candidatus Woesearchaeota archaeon]
MKLNHSKYFGNNLNSGASYNDYRKIDTSKAKKKFLSKIKVSRNKVSVDKEQWGQHFLLVNYQEGKAVLQKIIEAAQLSSADTILEIGAGNGTLTKELVKVAGKVIALEIDENFRPELEGVKNESDGKIDLFFINALYFLNEYAIEHKIKFNKIVANIPYQIGEPLLKYLCRIRGRDVEKAVLMVPAGFAEKMSVHPVFSAFLEFKVIEKVPRELFSPMPRVDSVVLHLERKNLVRKDSERNNKLEAVEFLVQELYKQRDKTLKNGLREALIEWSILERKLEKEIKPLTKKEALAFISKLELDDKLLDKRISQISVEEWKLLLEKINKVI